MKKILVLICSLSLVACLAFSASAETYEDFTLNLNFWVQQYPSGNTSLSLKQSIENKDSYLNASEFLNIPMDYNTMLKFETVIYNSTNSTIIKAGEVFTITISGLDLHVETLDDYYLWNKTPDFFYFELYYSDSTFTRFNDVVWSYNSGTETHSVTLEGVASKDVYRIDFYEEIEQYLITQKHGMLDISIVMGSLDTPTYLQVEIESKESGLLGDINDQLDDAINGEVEPDKSPVDDSINDMLGKEDELLQDTEKGFDDVLTYITQAISELVAYATAFVAMSAILDGFFALPIIGPLITISLALGIFALIVNLGQVADRADRANKAKASKASKGGKG